MHKGIRLTIVLVVLLYALMAAYFSGLIVPNFFARSPQILSYGPVSMGKPKQLFILLHGSSSDANDIMQIARAYAPSYPDAIFVAPEAPLPSKRHAYKLSWYYRGFAKADELTPKIEEIYPYLRDRVDDAMGRFGVSPEKTVLVGFSQGGTMALYLALHSPRNFAAVMSFAGYLPAVAMEGDINKNARVFLSRGALDKIMPDEDYEKMFSLLKQKGVDVSGYVVPGVGHDKIIALSHEERDFLEPALR